MATGTATGRAPATEPNQNARPLDLDRPVFERQPDETDAAWDAFTIYRDQEKRSVKEIGSSAPRWSVEWSWGHRVYQWDLYMSRIDIEEMVNYRRKMNDRHRRIAGAVQQKVVDWLANVTADQVQKMKPAEVARLLEISVRVEREAAGANLPEPVGKPQEGPPVPTLEELVEAADLEVDVDQFAEFLRTTVSP